jgi:hypothetical protein
MSTYDHFRVVYGAPIIKVYVVGGVPPLKAAKPPLSRELLNFFRSSLYYI